MTSRMYADRKEYDYESFTVSVNHGKIHAKDCEDRQTTDGRIDEFHRTITVAGNLSDQQQERILDIADRCPVHKTLHGEVKVRTSLNAD